MTPVSQTQFGYGGNCWPACLASLFEVPLADVDHCSQAHPDWHLRTQAWLASRGLSYFRVAWDPLSRSPIFPISPPADGSLLIAGGINAGGLGHTVIVKFVATTKDPYGYPLDGVYELVHDPMPGAQFITNIKFDALFFFAALHKA